MIQVAQHRMIFIKHLITGPGEKVITTSMPEIPYKYTWRDRDDNGRSRP